MLLVLVILAVIWVAIGLVSWCIGGYFAFWRTPERMARKHPDSVDPATGHQRVWKDLRDPENGGSYDEYDDHPGRPMTVGKARRWYRRSKHL